MIDKFRNIKQFTDWYKHFTPVTRENKITVHSPAGEILMLMFLLSALSSCSRSQHPIDVNPTPVDTTRSSLHIIDFGKLSLIKDGELWSPPTNFTVAYYGDGLPRFYINTERQYSNGVSHHFSILDIPCARGIYPILNIHVGGNTYFTPTSAYEILLDGDEPSGDLTVNVDTMKHDHNYVEIIDYNSIDSIVEGHFQLSLFKDPLGPPPLMPIPDSVHITEGKFYLKIQRKH